MSPHAPGIRTPSCPHTPQTSEHHHVPTRPERAEAPGAFGLSGRAASGASGPSGRAASGASGPSGRAACV